MKTKQIAAAASGYIRHIR